ncbi:MAG: TolC family protein [bacterium]|nr:TolC family protein [bacterium]
MKQLTIFVLLIAFFLSAPATAQPDPDSLLAAYIQEAWTNHPDLKAMQAMVSADSSRVGMSGSWMNPELRIGLMNLPDTFNLWSDPMTMLQVGIMQQIPFPGKLHRAARAEQARTAAARADLERGRDEMAAMVAMAFYDLAAAYQIRTAMLQGQTLADQMTQSAALMVGSGMGAQSDLYKARLDEEQWKLKLSTNQDEIEQKRSTLAYALGRSDAQAIADVILPNQPPPLPDPLTSFDDSPGLRSSQLLVQAAQSSLERARLDYYPDVNVMLAYGLRGDLKVGSMGNPMNEPLKQDNMISLELSFPIPLFYRGNQAAKTQEMGAMLTQSQNVYQKIRLEKRRELDQIYAHWKSKLDNYHTTVERILPAADNLWNSTLNDYRAGKVTIMNLAQARMSLVMARMDAAMLLADTWALRGQWQAALGMPLVESKEGN